MKTDNIEEMINSSDKECRYLAVSMIRYGDTKLSTKVKKSLISKVPVIERIKNLDDVYSELGIKEEDVLIFKEPKNKSERYINACAIIPKIVQAYNEGWFPNFNNHKQYKYFPYFEKVGLGWRVVVGGWNSGSSLGSGFYFKNKDLLMDACNKFSEIYNDWLD